MKSFGNYISLSFIFILFSGMVLAFISCDQKANIDTQAISQEVKNRKIKKIAEVDILDLADNRGRSTVAVLEKNWHAALKNGLENKGKEYAKKFCIVPFIPKYDSLAKNSVSIKKFGTEYKALKSKPDSIEIMIADAYQYNIENNLPLKPNVQRLEENYMLYTAPIFFDAESCSNCHSSGKNFNIISKAADNYAGFWSIKFSKKQLIEGASVD